MISNKKLELVVVVKLVQNTYFENFPDDINYLIVDQHKSVLLDQHHNKYKSIFALNQYPNC